ncbi:TetR/AcrR family transcriptional regulator [Vagococcus elongatus]|uniref:HTH tetR-type domain-containing protein n=1 Tax=Vagococcus elongatus TaxID=180344 RepID=A0A430AQS0_9ENTE|nr:TetR/AcrR family transcriptional regulator [Vagococcus elongatus]RSU10323.1 hypothetical protein CBF29_09940 [Vagococcus elongatus]
MSQKTSGKIREEKRKMILEKSRKVFGQKGYSNVTMKDIVDACQISRGGLYLYFSSIEELFQEVVIDQSKKKFNIINQMVEENQPFDKILSLYLELQKNRLLNIDDVILVATYEYYRSHQTEEQIQFQHSYVSYLKEIIYNVLALGVKQKAITNQNIDEIADTFIFLLEGMSVFRTFNQLSEIQITQQLNLLETLLEKSN